MFLADAQQLIEGLLRPLPLPAFMARLSEGRPYHVPGAGEPDRIGLLGAEPTELLLENHAWLADKLTFHAVAPSGPPPGIGPTPSEADFRARIAAFHERGYPVRFPDLRPLAPALDRLCRAFEMLLHQPVSASAFWSRSELRAPVHYDEHDIVAVQLRGERPGISRKGPRLGATTGRRFPARCRRWAQRRSA